MDSQSWVSSSCLSTPNITLLTQVAILNPKWLGPHEALLWSARTDVNSQNLLIYCKFEFSAQLPARLSTVACPAGSGTLWFGPGWGWPRNSGVPSWLQPSQIPAGPLARELSLICPFWSGSVIIISFGLPADHASLLICIDSWSWILASMALCSQSDYPQASPAWINSCVHGNTLDFVPSCSHLLTEDPNFAGCLMIVQFQHQANFSKKCFTELMETE